MVIVQTAVPFPGVLVLVPLSKGGRSPPPELKTTRLQNLLSLPPAGGRSPPQGNSIFKPHLHKSQNTPTPPGGGGVAEALLIKLTSHLMIYQNYTLIIISCQ